MITQTPDPLGSSAGYGKLTPAATKPPGGGKDQAPDPNGRGFGLGRQKVGVMLS